MCLYFSLLSLFLAPHLKFFLFYSNFEGISCKGHFFRFAYFVFEQPRQLDYSDEGGPTDACSPNMSNGRGPFK
jgi:hypothetical protein